MAKRWHPGSLLHEAEEDEARANREEQPSERLDGKDRKLRHHRRPSPLRCDAVYR